ncbi:hypothetical protein GALMADRAFT_1274823 [Galerina marginata CBS 339.88]|uniref:Uncharacterized protein n=1 Tax=Galerina marginata (strain CBS 339.88) TaxID=685588 RepID=A0A067T929_GALM3|nr:hypothetical protein GALMADRAFT_1274823 [Galerina marginata CBS 339.88]
MIAKSIRDMNRLIGLKPTRVKHEVQCKLKSGKLHVTSQRYKTKVARPGEEQMLKLNIRQSNGTTRTQTAQMLHLQGRLAKLSVSAPAHGFVQSVETVGRESPTSAEEHRTSIMLQALQRRFSLSINPFITSIWLPLKKTTWVTLPRNRLSSPVYFPSIRKLNVSQERAVGATLSIKNADRVVLIHGPPGTGKTTVIAATVTSLMASADKSCTLWLVAQSNVAVKNIAEKLASVNFFNFKIIVSKDYHFDWHEHQYEKIIPNVIRSDSFPEDLVHAERQLQGSRVMLCTLGMFSNIRLANILLLVPPQTVIFDEASQIEVGDYFPMLVQFQSTLQKLVFIGDDKQLAPYGSTDIPGLESIFEKSHLRKKAILLDIQYRMPVPIGDFISRNVYKGRLKSQHLISDLSCCHFVDVDNGVEESQGRSWTNAREVDVAVKIASQLTSKGKSYRIITPYDPQRSRLEQGLKDEGLRWEDRCFNVDSFQGTRIHCVSPQFAHLLAGNEDDYIVISLVRTHKLGFLNEMRRVNVMLTRCKKGMVICTNRRFIEGPGAKSLVGKLYGSLGHPVWIDGKDVLSDGVEPFA